MTPEELTDIQADYINKILSGFHSKDNFMSLFRINYSAYTNRMKLPFFLSNKVAVAHARNARLVLEEYDLRSAIKRALHHRLARADLTAIIDFQRFSVPKDNFNSMIEKDRVNALDVYFSTSQAFRHSVLNSLETLINRLVDEYASARTDHIIAEQLKDEKTQAPAIHVIHDQIAFAQKSGELSAHVFAERKQVALDSVLRAKEICERRANEQADLCSIVARYHAALSKMSRTRGAYTLFMAGAELESYLKVKTLFPQDELRNPPLDADIVFALKSVMTTHAGLMLLFPIMQNISQEIERYAGFSGSIKELNRDIIDPLFNKLLEVRHVLDEEIGEITAELAAAGQIDSEYLDTSITATGAKLNWLRGVLTALGHFVIGNEKFKTIFRAVQDGSLTDKIKKTDAFAVSVASFLANSQSLLTRLAETAKLGFGWISWLFRLLG